MLFVLRMLVVSRRVEKVIGRFWKSRANLGRFSGSACGDQVILPCLVYAGRMHGRSKRSRDPETSPEADSSASGSVSLRPRSQRRVVPESLITSRRRDSAEGTSTPRDDDDEAEAEVDGSEKKQRFVWTPDLHHRFEVAVHKLGVANAKPQAIQQLMGCEEDGTIPTRQNIKSHLQKYRLRTGHRSESGRAMSSGPSGAPVNMPQALGGGMPMTQAAMDPIVQKQQTGGPRLPRTPHLGREER